MFRMSRYFRPTRAMTTLLTQRCFLHESSTGSTSKETTEADSLRNRITEVVREGYAEVSKKTAARTEEDAKQAAKVAVGMGYTEEELSSVPAEANMGLQCGNPTRYGNLKEGEIVLDLGSGGGIDVFLASKAVGPTGKAIGVDMTPEMVEQARASAAKAGLTNVAFIWATSPRSPCRTTPSMSSSVTVSLIWPPTRWMFSRRCIVC